MGFMPPPFWMWCYSNKKTKNTCASFFYKVTRTDHPNAGHLKPPKGSLGRTWWRDRRTFRCVFPRQLKTPCLKLEERGIEVHPKGQQVREQLVCVFKYCLFSPRKLGKIPILTNIFQMGWNHQLDNGWREKLGKAASKHVFLYPKNHGISHHWWFGDPKEPCHTHPNPSFLECPMILRVIPIPTAFLVVVKLKSCFLMLMLKVSWTRKYWNIYKKRGRWWYFGIPTYLVRRWKMFVLNLPNRVVGFCFAI